MDLIFGHRSRGSSVVLHRPRARRQMNSNGAAGANSSMDDWRLKRVSGLTGGDSVGVKTAAARRAHRPISTRARSVQTSQTISGIHMDSQSQFDRGGGSGQAPRNRHRRAQSAGESSPQHERGTPRTGFRSRRYVPGPCDGPAQGSPPPGPTSNSCPFFTIDNDAIAAYEIAENQQRSSAAHEIQIVPQRSI